MAAKKNNANRRDRKELQGITCENLSFAASEAYKLLRTNLQFALADRPCKIIGMTSSLRGEGKSTTSVNLCYTLAQSGKRVLLIDADMRLPTIHAKMELSHAAPGLSNLLAGLCEDKESLRVSRLFNNWYIMPAGDIPPNPSELLGSEHMHALLERFSAIFDVIVIDLPPLNIVADALVISPWIDGLILVVRQNYTSARALNDCMYQIEKVNARFLGFVLTDAAVGESSYKGYRYSRYGKYGKYGKYGQYGDDYGYGESTASKKTSRAFRQATSGDDVFDLSGDSEKE